MRELTPEVLKDIVKQAIREECAGRVTVRIPRELVERSVIVFAGLFAMFLLAAVLLLLVARLGGLAA